MSLWAFLLMKLEEKKNFKKKGREREREREVVIWRTKGQRKRQRKAIIWR